MSYEKLYMLEVVTDLGSTRFPVAYSHSIKKLKRLVPTVKTWHVGSDDVTNSPEVVAYTENKRTPSFPLYWIREVPFVI